MSLDQIGLLPPDQQEAILNGPALAPPNGLTPNFDHPPNDNPVALAAMTICLIVATIAAVLRIYSRVIVLKRVFLEDCKIEPCAWIVSFD